MYEIVTRNKNVEKRLNDYIRKRDDIYNKLKRLKIDPRRNCGAHPLYGELKGKWSCWLGSNIRMIYKIDGYLKLLWLKMLGHIKFIKF